MKITTYWLSNQTEQVGHDHDPWYPWTAGAIVSPLQSCDRKTHWKFRKVFLKYGLSFLIMVQVYDWFYLSTT